MKIQFSLSEPENCPRGILRAARLMGYAAVLSQEKKIEKGVRDVNSVISEARRLPFSSFSSSSSSSFSSSSSPNLVTVPREIHSFGTERRMIYVDDRPVPNLNRWTLQHMPSINELDG